MFNPKRETQIVVNFENESEDPARVKRALVVCQNVEVVINSVEFRDELIRRFSLQYSAVFAWAVYKELMEGVELLQNDKKPDYTWQLYFDFYYNGRSRVVARTYPNIREVQYNTSFFFSNPLTLNESNVVHEQGHKLGYGEEVCYLLNDVYEAVRNLVIKNKYQEKQVTVCRRRFFIKRCWSEYVLIND